MLEITARVDETVRKYSMLDKGDSVVVGVSGGADSMFLLNYLIGRRDELNLKLIVANVEHGIRGQESVDDTEFVKNYCRNNNLEFHSLSIDAVSESSENGMGIEEYSRKIRYEFFDSFDADKIATAHNLSDNVETFLFRLARGTSLKGLLSIPVVRGNIIRPLITLSSEEIREFCRKKNIEYRVDSTNDCDEYTRNRIRHNIVPQFEKINPSFEHAVSRLISVIDTENDYMQHLCEKLFSEAFDGKILSTKSLRSCHEAVIKRVIVMFFERYSLPYDEFHINEVYKLFYKNGKCQITDNCFAISNKDTLRIADYNNKVNLSDIIVNKLIIGREQFLTNGELLHKQFAFYCDCDKINGNVTVRNRKQGDTITPAKRNCSKTLKKLFNEYKIPVEDRDSVFVLCDDDGLIGVYDYCIDERVRVDKDTQNILLIEILLEEVN